MIPALEMFDHMIRRINYGCGQHYQDIRTPIPRPARCHMPQLLGLLKASRVLFVMGIIKYYKTYNLEREIMDTEGLEATAPCSCASFVCPLLLA